MKKIKIIFYSIVLFTVTSCSSITPPPRLKGFEPVEGVVYSYTAWENIDNSGYHMVVNCLGCESLIFPIDIHTYESFGTISQTFIDNKPAVTVILDENNNSSFAAFLIAVVTFFLGLAVGRNMKK